VPDGVPAGLTEPLRRHEVVMIGTSAPQPRCIALAGRVGDDASCSIHGRHPSPCKAVEPGSSQCRRAREHHGLPPLDEVPGPDRDQPASPPLGRPAAGGRSVSLPDGPFVAD